MKKNNKNEKGITLIALVITIIVMLILVGVTITMAINGGLFGYAKDAADQTNEQIELERQMANVLPDQDYDYLIDKYTTD